jgi:hypothetical protein
VKEMVTKKMLQELVKSYDREGAWAKLEGLYISAISFPDFYNVYKNIEIRYGTDEPIENVWLDIKRLCGEDRIPYETEDTSERYEDIIAKACEEVFPEFLTEKVRESILSLSKIAKRFVFLLYKEGSILNGKISTTEETALSHFTPAYKIIFGKLGEDEYKIHGEVLQEIIKAGLVYEWSYSTARKRHYYHFTVPPFAKEVWLKLPDIISLPAINVEEVW